MEDDVSRHWFSHLPSRRNTWVLSVSPMNSILTTGILNILNIFFPWFPNLRILDNLLKLLMKNNFTFKPSYSWRLYFPRFFCLFVCLFLLSMFGGLALFFACFAFYLISLYPYLILRSSKKPVGTLEIWPQIFFSRSKSN